MLQTSQSVYDGRFLSRLGLGGSGGRGGHSAAPDIRGSFSVGGDGLSGRFIPEQIEKETNKQRLSVVNTRKEQEGFKTQRCLDP